MKKLVVSFIWISLFAFIARAQKTNAIKGLAADTAIFYVVEHQPTFPGGGKAYQKFLKNNLKWPDKSGMIDIQGRVIVQFLVEKNGSITHVKVLRGIDPLFDTEALRVINNMPKWNPGIQNGHIVRSYYILPIPFIMK